MGTAIRQFGSSVGTDVLLIGSRFHNLTNKSKIIKRWFKSKNSSSKSIMSGIINPFMKTILPKSRGGGTGYFYG